MRQQSARKNLSDERRRGLCGVARPGLAVESQDVSAFAPLAQALAEAVDDVNDELRVDDVGVFFIRRVFFPRFFPRGRRRVHLRRHRAVPPRRSRARRLANEPHEEEVVAPRHHERGAAAASRRRRERSDDVPQRRRRLRERVERRALPGLDVGESQEPDEALRVVDRDAPRVEGSAGPRRDRARVDVRVGPVPVPQGRSIQSDGGVEFKGVRWSLKASRSGIEREGWAERCAGKSP
eukprot:29508-Pelagococcus_subviridis.AAC.2